MSINLKFFIEEIGEGFNLWTKVEGRYLNRATLFYNDSSCGTQWDVSAPEKSVSYREQEITDELESPLVEITESSGEALLNMAQKSPKEVYDYFRNISLEGGSC